jgi:hypothetical protein
MSLVSQYSRSVVIAEGMKNEINNIRNVGGAKRLWHFREAIANKQIFQSQLPLVLPYGTVTWALTQKTEQILCTSERKILRRIYGPIQDNGLWRPRWNGEIYNLHKDLNIMDDIKIRILGSTGRFVRMEEERVPKKVLNGKFHNKIPVRKPVTRWENVVHRRS